MGAAAGMRRARAGLGGAGWFAMALLGLASAGCDEERPPMPIITVQVLPGPDRYVLNQQPMKRRQLERELAQLAELNRRGQAHGGVRAYVRVQSRPGADNDQVMAVAEYCQSIGLNNLQLER